MSGNDEKDRAAPDSLGEVLGILTRRANQRGEDLTIGGLLHELGPRSYGPLLLVPALLALIPVVGAIPGVSIVTGTLLILLAAQIAVGRERPWMPNKLLEISLPQEKTAAVLERSRRWAKVVDRVVRRRYAWMTRPPGLQVVAVVLIGIALLFYPTALIPWGVTPPALAATLLSLSITVQDGLLAVAGLLVSAASVWVVVAFWPF